MERSIWYFTPYQFRLYRLKLNEIKGLLAFTGLELEYVLLKESNQLF